MCRIHLTVCPGQTRSRRSFPPVANRTVMLVVIVCICNIFFIAGCVADEVHRRTGILAVCSPFSPIIAVDLRESDLGGFVVGRITADSRLQKGGRPVGQHDFNAGETVTVTWRKSPQGTSILTLLAGPSSVLAPAAGRPAKDQPLIHDNRDFGALIGKKRRHLVVKKDTLLDIARRYDLGFNEITALYPQYDPWLPPVGTMLEIPSQWLLPDSKSTGLVVNIPEMRLFVYTGRGGKQSVRTFPIGIGDADYPTPTGSYRIGEKRIHPTWYIPPSLREKYHRATFPPGPGNPLGDYWMGLEGTLYGIHGTDIPWSVGRMVTHGCIRMYPEDITELFPSVKKGTKVQLVYQPVKVALISGRIYIEVHRDVYSLFDNLAAHGYDIIVRKGFAHLVDLEKLLDAIALENGIPADITLEQVDRTNRTLQ